MVSAKGDSFLCYLSINYTTRFRIVNESVSKENPLNAESILVQDANQFSRGDNNRFLWEMLYITRHKVSTVLRQRDLIEHNILMIREQLIGRSPPRIISEMFDGSYYIVNIFGLERKLIS